MWKNLSDKTWSLKWKSGGPWFGQFVWEIKECRNWKRSGNFGFFYFVIVETMSVFMWLILISGIFFIPKPQQKCHHFLEQHKPNISIIHFDIELIARCVSVSVCVRLHLFEIHQSLNKSTNINYKAFVAVCFPFSAEFYGIQNSLFPSLKHLSIV